MARNRRTVETRSSRSVSLKRSTSAPAASAARPCERSAAERARLPPGATPTSASRVCISPKTSSTCTARAAAPAGTCCGSAARRPARRSTGTPRDRLERRAVTVPPRLGFRTVKNAAARGGPRQEPRHGALAARRVGAAEGDAAVAVDECARVPPAEEGEGERQVDRGRSVVGGRKHLRSRRLQRHRERNRVVAAGRVGDEPQARPVEVERVPAGDEVAVVLQDRHVVDVRVPGPGEGRGPQRARSRPVRVQGQQVSRRRRASCRTSARPRHPPRRHRARAGRRPAPSRADSTRAGVVCAACGARGTLSPIRASGLQDKAIRWPRKRNSASSCSSRRSRTSASGASTARRSWARPVSRRS